MTFIIIILIILLIVSIVNNYIMYQRKINFASCPKQIINKINLPDNTDYKNIIFFYKKNKYDKCYKRDLKDKIDSSKVNRYEGEMIIKEMIDSIKRKYSDKIYIISNSNNLSTINLSDENIIGIKYLPDKK